MLPVYIYIYIYIIREHILAYTMHWAKGNTAEAAACGAAAWFLCAFLTVCVFVCVCVCLTFGLLSSRLFFDPLPASPPPPLAPSHAEHSMQQEIM